ncbi:MAG: gamma carbonic anhydrase family protein [Gammaproteobacteria bacterium]|nr:gamma carbonic anhydrase family protein [Gammaproteobacteria bacterium]MYF37818.1 gamma carbonic anhydrase family protein [Gammaproteobacteria bacterium]
MPIYEFDSHRVETEAGVWIAPTASVIGRVFLRRGSSIWWGTVLRGDYDSISVGRATNVQDNCVIHTDPGYPVIIGDQVTIGHNAVVHGCTIGDNSLIGINSTILNGVEIGKNVLVGSNSLITEGKKIPDGVLVLGSPGRIVRELSSDEIDDLPGFSDRYVKNASNYRTKLSQV